SRGPAALAGTTPTTPAAHPRVAEGTPRETPSPLRAADPRPQGTPSADRDVDRPTGLRTDARRRQADAGGRVHQTRSLQGARHRGRCRRSESGERKTEN